MTASPEARRVALNVKTMLARAGLTQRTLCARIGMAESSLSQKMKGKTDWSLTDLSLIAHAVSVSVPELTGQLPDLDLWDRRLDTRTAGPLVAAGRAGGDGGI